MGLHPPLGPNQDCNDAKCKEIFYAGICLTNCFSVGGAVLTGLYAENQMYTVVCLALPVITTGTLALYCAYKFVKCSGSNLEDCCATLKNSPNLCGSRSPGICASLWDKCHKIGRNSRKIDYEELL